ncbi:hypothetical protein [Parvicella tangerina]|uniref:Outer membrane protein beta-barrel domain-containing protein n=1 Tax=Parvicella tangerina TaxID=2829795 RepID=A0A916JMS7_9FLAO|nr:hypothetical protein [Parvicella tangerina]CAG5080913.1 hypothetical protein CRYO30217_01479 [Parvicella tangerina]
MKSWIVILLAIIGFQNCAPSRVIKPLEIGEQSVSMSLGGPMAKIPGVATLPIPFTNLSYARGCKENLTLTGSIYPTTMLFGTYQFDLGVNYGFIKQENWGISSTLLFNQAFDQWQRNYKIWPNLDINAYYELKKETASFLFYGGVNNWFEFSKIGAHDRPQDVHWIFSPQFGITLSKEKWSYQLEYKMIGPNLNNQYFVVTYSSLLPQTGANGLYFGITRKF